MKAEFDLLNTTRQVVLKSISELSLKQLNKVPNGYRNSIAWNVAHIVVTQQILHYKFSGNEILVPTPFVEQYKKGTEVLASISDTDWKQVLEFLKTLPVQLSTDYKLGKFSNYDSYMTSYGYELHNIEEAITFNNVHEALHLGYIMAMKKQV
jgi:hypothetical protein